MLWKSIYLFTLSFLLAVPTLAKTGTHSAPDRNPRCDVTFQGFHGGSEGEIHLDLFLSEVRTRIGWWAKISRIRNGARKVMNPGDHVSDTANLRLACNAQRRYRFHFWAEVDGSTYNYNYYYPSQSGFTQETIIDLGDVSRFFEAIEPGPPPAEEQPAELDLSDVQGEWIRQASNNNPNDGMRIEVSGDQAVLTFVPESAGVDWQEGEILWREISPDGKLEVLGSDNHHYPAAMTLRGTSSIDIDVHHNGAGNDQTWVRSQTGANTETDPDDEYVTQQQALSVLTSSVWDSNSIPVCWEDVRSDEADERRWSQEAVENTWERESAVDFTGWGSCDDDSEGIRVEVQDIGPHADELGSGLNGLERGMSLNFTFSNWNTNFDCTNTEAEREWCIRAIAVHEFGHAMAIAHEQNRSDSPFNCQSTQTQGTNPDWNVTPYDLFSVMNYCNPAWTGNGQLSPSDIMGAVRLYGSGDGNRLGIYEDGDLFGWTLAKGDFDDDGFDDLAVGAFGEAIEDANASGAVFIYRGTEAGGLRPWHSLTQDGLGNNERGDNFGFSLATGDFNNDGRDDLAVGAPQEAPGDSPRWSGAVFVFQGTPDGLEPWHAYNQESAGLGINEDGDRFGTALAAGDFDGDNHDDLAVGAPFEEPDEDPKSGAVYLFRGTSDQLEPWKAITPADVNENVGGERFGESLVAGDFIARGWDDLAVGAPRKTIDGNRAAGAVFVFEGGPDGLEPHIMLTQDGLGDNERNDMFGQALALGDFNDDGWRDLAVGAPREAPGNRPAGGAVFLFENDATSLVPLEVLTQDDLGSTEANDQFGSSLAAGDFDGDGADDLAVGAPGEAPGNRPESGAVFVFRGNSSGMIPLRVLLQDEIGSNEDGDRLGSALVVGRFSDHASDHLVVGAPGEAPGDEPRAGYVFVYANLDNDPTDTIPATMRGWYAFGQQY